MSRTVHIVGGFVRVGSRVRQRCAWCGYEIIAEDLRNVMLAPNEDGTPPEFGEGFQPGSLLAIEGTNPMVFQVLAHVDGAQIPAGFCGDDKPRLYAVEERKKP